MSPPWSALPLPSLQHSSRHCTPQRLNALNKDRGVVVERRAAQGRDRQDEVARDHPRGEALPPLAAPVVDLDLGTS
jgi:hypothetical protein